MDLAIFLKAPVAGKVKTRLCPPLSEDEALQLYTVFVEDLLDAASQTRSRSIWLIHDGPRPSEYLPDELLARLNDPLGRLRELPQREGDLGERLQRAVKDLDLSGSLPVLFVGSDHPDLPTLAMDHLLVALPSADLILGEASDGGAWGIGVSTPHPGLFESIAWSRADTASSLLDRAASLNLSSRLLSPWHDVDELNDLTALWGRLECGESEAPRTRAWLENWTRRAEVFDEFE